MKKLIIFALLLLLAAGFTACGASKDAAGQDSSASVSQAASGDTGATGDENANSNTGGKEARYYPNAVEGYKTAHNEKFDFWFDMPEEWKAVDRSESNDGYYILTDSGAMDIRIYGVLKDTSDDEFYSKLTGKDGKIEDFTYNDGKIGKKIINSSERVYFVRDDGDSLICFYVNYKNDRTWYETKANREKLDYTAMSIRPQQKGPKLDSGENKISMEDLKLGKIYIDMPDTDVKNTMKAGLVNEDTDEYQGRTLFYDDGTEIYIIDGIVNSMNVNNDKYPTPKGLKVGDSVDRIVELYGQPDNKEDDTHWGYTVDGYELFSIVLENGKVSQLQIDMLGMGLPITD